jgi:uncharacterized protein
MPYDYDMLVAVYAALISILFAASWAGHAFLWTTVLNYLYARPYPKVLLRVWRLATGIAVLGFPLLLAPALSPSSLGSTTWAETSPIELLDGACGRTAAVYWCLCLVVGAVIYPALNVHRLLRKPPAALVSEQTETIDLWKQLGPAALGNGYGLFAARLPLNCIFQVDFTELTLALPNLPAEWDGLTILHITDVHFHGTPSRAFFEHVFSEVGRRWPENDLVCLTGDFVDTDQHHAWISPLLGRFQGKEGNFAILGNHDANHDPERIRQSVADAGYRVLGSSWCETKIRGARCVVVGNEGPWFAPPELKTAPADAVRLCLSHTPDHFYWGQANRVDLMLCGHVHGGQIRLPAIGSIFVPSVYGRRFDMGVFEGNGTTMVVGRGLSGKEPLRFRCHPQVLRIRLQARI